MPWVRPPEPDAQEGDVETDGPITARDRLDPRVFLLPNAPQNLPDATPAAWEPEVVLAWAVEHAPSYVLDDQMADRNARRRTDLDALRAMTPDDRRRVLRERRRQGRTT